MSNDENIPPTLLTFPCDFTIKVFGKSSPEFESIVREIIKNEVANPDEIKIQTRPSENGKYSALNVTIHVDSKQQLDDIYRKLSASSQIIMTL